MFRGLDIDRVFGVDRPDLLKQASRYVNPRADGGMHAVFGAIIERLNQHFLSSRGSMFMSRTST
jgi:hypothetical protein